MKDDFGREWKKNDHFMALICIILLIIAILIPSLMWGGIIYIFDLNSEQIFGGTIGILVFWCIGMILLELKWSKDRRLMWKRHLSTFQN